MSEIEPGNGLELTSLISRELNPNNLKVYLEQGGDPEQIVFYCFPSKFLNVGPAEKYTLYKVDERGRIMVRKFGTKDAKEAVSEFGAWGMEEQSLDLIRQAVSKHEKEAEHFLGIPGAGQVLQGIDSGVSGHVEPEVKEAEENKEARQIAELDNFLQQVFVVDYKVNTDESCFQWKLIRDSAPKDVKDDAKRLYLVVNDDATDRERLALKRGLLQQDWFHVGDISYKSDEHKQSVSSSGNYKNLVGIVKQRAKVYGLAEPKTFVAGFDDMDYLLLEFS